MCMDAGSKQNKYIAVTLEKWCLVWQPSLCISQKRGDTMAQGLRKG